MTALATTFTTLPCTQLRRNRHFYLYYDGVYAGLCLALVAAVHLTGFGGLLTHFEWWYLAFLPLACYAHILASVFVHVCTHGSLPKPWNRLVGEICGVIIVTRFASWEVLHQRHHRNSDDVEKDPHALDASYLRFCLHHVLHLEKHLHATVFDLHGDTPENRRYERIRSFVSFATGMLLIYTWYAVLGPVGFFAFFVPASIVGFFHLVHFNWSTHNAFSPTHDFKPVNLDHGLFKLGNKLFFGIYMHANHHKRPNVLNPAKMQNSLPLTPPPTRDEIEAGKQLLAARRVEQRELVAG